jgi:methionyl-tRNA synthetase
MIQKEENSKKITEKRAGQKSFYITTTLPYVNAELHIGHALEFVRADTIARYKRSAGYEVFFNTGSDEHGTNIFESAKKNSVTPQMYVDTLVDSFKEVHSKLNISYDSFIRTTDKAHIKAANEIWKRCFDNGYIYKKNYKTKYCVGCELSKTDSELEKGLCPIHPNREIVLLEEENYFFKWSEFQEKLETLYIVQPDFVIPSTRLNEIKAFVSRGLEDFSISRLASKMPWGIPVPGDSEHVMYVWFDALTSYIAATGFPDGQDFTTFWLQKSEEKPREVVQYCGKDNLRQQSAMWQAMLLAADIPLSTTIVINGFVLSGGQKMSKTVGNVISPLRLVEEYAALTDYPEDVLRFALLHDVPSFEDGDITAASIRACYTAHLVNGLGNLTSRIMRMATTHSIVSLDTEKYINPDVINALDVFDIKKALEACMLDVRNLDKFIQETEPFKVVKVNEEKGHILIGECLSDLRRIACAIEIFMPRTGAKILECIDEHKMPEQALFRRV